MAVTAPSSVSTNPWRRLAADLRTERRIGRRLPPGPIDFSVARTRQFARNPLPVLIDAYERYGPIFTIRVLHAPVVFMLGPEANHYMTVSHAERFGWRDGSMGDLIPLLGDGLLTTDGDYHRRARRTLLPAFHHERILAAGDTMLAEIDRELAGWRPGERIDLYTRTRRLAMRIAMRALFGLDPDRGPREAAAAADFERALSLYGRDYFLQLLRGPHTPFDRMVRARGRLDAMIFGEIERRRAAPPDAPMDQDLLGLLLQAHDEDGPLLSDRQIRDQVMTMLFAGHDTTTSTVSFLLYELARNPGALARIQAEQDRVLDGRAPTAAELTGELPELEMAVDETLRLYPPAWVGPRRALQDFEFAGHGVPAGTLVNYSSWASHHLADVFPDPEAFVPDRFAPERRAALPKGAYVPFGGGSRICIGMRFGQLEVKAIATRVLQRFRLELVPGYELTVRQMPTLSPRGGLPMTVRDRGPAMPVRDAAPGRSAAPGS